jgi:2,3-bisphosphoglycerate-independent phosphoglycerate mutase
MNKPVLLLILDGWGYREAAPDNAISMANTPHWDALWGQHPHTLVHTEGKFVGLPDGQMGNSEVGHMNIGAGRIVYQELTRVDAEIESGEFFKNTELRAACEAANKNNATLHVFGLLSPGGVHSHESHIFAMLRLAQQCEVKRVAMHAFLDGRDMPPQSAEPSLRALNAVINEVGNAQLATVSGRYYAMDRDNRWERVQAAYDAMVDAKSEFHSESGLHALQAAYARGENDEFVKPTVINQGCPFAAGDAVVFMNFRADRARQLTRSFVQKEFAGFARAREISLSRFVCLTEYASDIAAPAAYKTDSLQNTLSEVLSKRGKRQLRIAETEKYAHVTFFFSGGKEALAEGEERVLIPSPKVATYDLQPEMSCPELTEKLCAAVRSQSFDFIACNIANPDMVGHSGVLDAAIKAAEAVDIALGEVMHAIDEVDGVLLVTADHGNLEMMLDPETGQPHTSHTVGPVPFVLYGRDFMLRSGGALRDIAPTVLQLMNLPQPAEMTGSSLIVA